MRPTLSSRLAGRWWSARFLAAIVLVSLASQADTAEAKSLTPHTASTAQVREADRSWHAWLTECSCWRWMFGDEDAENQDRQHYVLMERATPPRQDYGLQIGSTHALEKSNQPLVVFIHGYNSTPERGRALLRDSQEAGFDCATFAYPNDGPLEDSAQLLSKSLRKMASTYPKKRIYLVTYSMGGLVARAAVENPRLAPGNVERLIMVAPPSHGTLVAPYAVGTDVWEHGLARCSGSPWQRLEDSRRDGNGEATIDLTPGSEFLTRLNHHGLRDDIQYSLILGSTAPVSPARIAWLQRQLDYCEQSCPWTSERIAELSNYLGNFDEIVAGRGDGVVAIQRGRLAGVNDTIVLPFGHLEVIDETAQGIGPRVRQAILQRLR